MSALEASTPITKLHLSSDAQSILTKAAQTLTKGDLLTISRLQTENGPTSVEAINQAIGKSLTITDLVSVANAYGQQSAQAMAGVPEAAANGGCCCCCTCTPCCSCCANVVTTPFLAA